MLDSLTYAGNRESLKPVEDEIEFVHGDICDAALVDRLVGAVRHGRALRGRVARGQLAARPVAVHPDQRGRHLHDPRGGPQARQAAAPHLHRRGLRRPRPRRRRPVHRVHAVRPVEPVLGDQGELGPARPRLGALVRHPRDALELRQQLRPVPARREVHPAPDHERLHRRPPEALRAGRERARVDPRRRPQRGRPPDPEQGRAGRDLPDRLRRRAQQQGDPRAHPRADGRARRRLRPRPRPARPRPALLQRLDQDPHPARLDAALRRLPRRPGGHDRLVPRQRLVVEAAEGSDRGALHAARQRKGWSPLHT